LNSSTICQGESASLSLPLADAYIWSNGANTQAITISNIGTTTVSAQIVVSGCTSAVSNSATIVVNAKPTVDIAANPGTTVKKGDAFTLTASGATTYTWNTGATTNSIELRPEEVGTFTYSVTGTSNGCTSDTKEIVIIVEFKGLRIPTGFSPNNDGVNDMWQIEGLEAFPTALIEVFSRNGTKVFSKDGGHSTEEVWKGDDLPAGTYYFVIDTKDQTEGKKSGKLTIVR
jgi:gliding motility-associated-like protein